MNRFASAKKLASTIIKKYDLKPPIDPISVIKSYGIEIVECNNQLGIEAYSDLASTKKIYVNTEYTFTPRKRFTLAHEFGHIFIPWHNGDIKCDTDKPYNIIDGKRLLDTQELEANIFASELLMPSSWLKEQVNPNEKIDLEELIKRVSRSAETSVLACIYALENALPSGHLYFVKKDNADFWKKFASCRTATCNIYYEGEKYWEFWDSICEDKNEFHISQYDVIHYKLLPCPLPGQINELYNCLNYNISELVSVLSNYEPTRILPVLNYILDQLNDSYVLAIFKDGKKIKTISHEESPIKIPCTKYSELIEALDNPNIEYQELNANEYSLVFIKEKMFEIPVVPNKEPNQLLKSIVGEIYVNSIDMLRRINGVMSYVNSCNRSYGLYEMYNMAKYRFVLDKDFKDFIFHPLFDVYLVNKIQSMISKRK